MLGRAVTASLVLALLAGCGSSKPGSVREDVLRGVEQIRASHSAKKLHGQLTRTLASLREEHASAATERTARRLAIRGFEAALQGIGAQIDLIENDSGNLEAAVRDASKADRYWKKGATLLRAAGRSLGIAVGTLKGY
jgi:exonuclease VII small subunit